MFNVNFFLLSNKFSYGLFVSFICLFNGMGNLCQTDCKSMCCFMHIA